MQDYLKVQSRDGRWELLYVDMDSSKLRYWRTKEDQESGAMALKELDVRGATWREGPEPHTWAVVSDSADVMYFQAEKEDQKNAWMTQLQRSDVTKPSSKKVSLKDFEKKFVLGRGSYGKVYMVVKKDTGRWYAMKEMSAEKMRQAEIKTPYAERIILEEIDHPFIVHLHYSFQEGGNFYLILDLLAGGELFTYIEQHAPLDEEMVKFYASEVALALGYLHSRNIIYRDLKPENVVFDGDGHTCLTDFGLAKTNVYEANAVTYCGTNEYLAPELLKGVPHGKAVDWWSLGLMMCEMLYNDLPFYDDNPMQMQTKILTEDVKFPPHIHTSEETKDLIRRLLHKNPEKRLQTLKEFKMHKSVRDIDFDRLLRRELKAPITPDPNPARNFSPEFTEEVIEPGPGSSPEVFDAAGFMAAGGAPHREAYAGHSPPTAELPGEVMSACRWPNPNTTGDSILQGTKSSTVPDSKFLSTSGVAFSSAQEPRSEQSCSNHPAS